MLFLGCEPGRRRSRDLDREGDAREVGLEVAVDHCSRSASGPSIARNLEQVAKRLAVLPPTWTAHRRHGDSTVALEGCLGLGFASDWQAGRGAF